MIQQPLIAPAPLAGLLSSIRTPLIHFFGDTFEGFAVALYAPELALLRGAGGFVALGVVLLAFRFRLLPS
jgi:hypothetical protein